MVGNDLALCGKVIEKDHLDNGTYPDPDNSNVIIVKNCFSDNDVEYVRVLYSVCIYIFIYIYIYIYPVGI